MKPLSPTDFKKITLEGGYSYFSYKHPNFEICLEPCLNGFDVAIYSNEQELLDSKQCTDMELPDAMDKTSQFIVIARALKIANELMNKHSNRPEVTI
jgi:hypothetical protein